MSWRPIPGGNETELLAPMGQGQREKETHKTDEEITAVWSAGERNQMRRRRGGGRP
jgi:hypothetical protein